MLPLEAIPGLNGFVLFFALPCMLFRFGTSMPAGQLVELYRKLHNVGNAALATSLAPACGVVFSAPVSAR